MGAFYWLSIKVCHKTANKTLDGPRNHLFITDVVTLVKCVLISKSLFELLRNAKFARIIQFWALTWKSNWSMDFMVLD